MKRSSVRFRQAAQLQGPRSRGPVPRLGLLPFRLPVRLAQWPTSGGGEEPVAAAGVSPRRTGASADVGLVRRSPDTPTRVSSRTARSVAPSVRSSDQQPRGAADGSTRPRAQRAPQRPRSPSRRSCLHPERSATLCPQESVTLQDVPGTEPKSSIAGLQRGTREWPRPGRARHLIHPEVALTWKVIG